MEHIVIGICTFNRRHCMPALLTSIANLIAPENTQITILIVNNNLKDSDHLTELITTIAMPFSLKLVHEANIGLSYARNRVLIEALTLNAEVLAFTDDDCIVPAHWLVTLYRAYLQYGRYMVAGTRHYLFPSNSSKLQRMWIEASKMILPLDLADGTAIVSASTHNVLFNLKLVPQYKLYFDADFNHCGGEDVMFFTLLSEKTNKLGVFLKDAYVYEVLHAYRVSIWWILKRYFCHGITLAYHYRKARKLTFVHNRRMTHIVYLSAAKIMQCFCRGLSAISGLSIDIVGYLIMGLGFVYCLTVKSAYRAYSSKGYK